MDRNRYPSAGTAASEAIPESLVLSLFPLLGAQNVTLDSPSSGSDRVNARAIQARRRFVLLFQRFRWIVGRLRIPRLSPLLSGEAPHYPAGDQANLIPSVLRGPHQKSRVYLLLFRV